MCKFGTTERVLVHIDADLSYTGKERRVWASIDKCIAPIVRALQRGGINMRGSCCAHGKGPGQIDLSDGRMIRIYPKVTGWPERLRNYDTPRTKAPKESPA